MALAAQEPRGGLSVAIPPLHLFGLGRLPFHDARVASGVKMPQWHTKNARPIKTHHFGDADNAGDRVGSGAGEG